MVYTVEGDNVIKQTAQNFLLQILRYLTATPEDVKSFIEEKYKGYNDLKVLNKRLKSKMKKETRSRSWISVASISELRKVLPEEYSVKLSNENEPRLAVL